MVTPGVVLSWLDLAGGREEIVSKPRPYGHSVSRDHLLFPRFSLPSETSATDLPSSSSRWRLR